VLRCRHGKGASSRCSAFLLLAEAALLLFGDTSPLLELPEAVFAASRLPRRHCAKEPVGKRRAIISYVSRVVEVVVRCVVSVEKANAPEPRAGKAVAT
jgi:hypothetical protein